MRRDTCLGQTGAQIFLRNCCLSLDGQGLEQKNWGKGAGDRENQVFVDFGRKHNAWALGSNGYGDLP